MAERSANRFVEFCRWQPWAAALVIALAMAGPAAAVGGLPANSDREDSAAARQLITRDEIERSGAISLADLLRAEAFNSFGARRPASFGGNEQVSGVNLHGLGGQYTLVLVDGRRLMPTATLSDEQNLNVIPLAAVERIEILSGGASAIYGSDAVAGVINVVTRRAFEGVTMSISAGSPKHKGGDTESGSIVFGSSGDEGELIAGVAWANRDLVESTDRAWSRDGLSTFSNNFLSALPVFSPAEQQFITGGFLNNPTFGSAVPGSAACSGAGFLANHPRCFYRFQDLSTDDVETRQRSLFASGRRKLDSGWTAFLDASVTRLFSFGRLAPSSSALWTVGRFSARELPLIRVGSPNHPAVRFPDAGYDPTRPVFLRHRFAGLGPITTQADGVNYSAIGGASGRMGAVDIEFGAGIGEDDYTEFNRNVVVVPLAQARIDDGTYDIYDPYGNSRSVLDSIAATTSRDANLKHEQIYLKGSTDLFAMGGGSARLSLGVEGRQETLTDRYDTLQTAGLTTRLGDSLARFDADGSRDLRALHAGLMLPVSDALSLDGALRYDDYSDTGSETSARLGLNYRLSDSLSVYAAVSRDFNAPGLAETSVQASSSNALLFARCFPNAFPAGFLCALPTRVLRVTNPALQAEQSKQWNVGLDWRPSNWLELGLYIYDIEIKRRLQLLTPTSVIECLVGTSVGPCPSNLGRFAGSTPNPSSGLGSNFNPVTGAVSFVQFGLFNQGRLETSGADLRMSTRWEFNGAGALDSELRVGRVQDFRIDGGENLVGDAALPRWRASLNTRWQINDFTATWNIRHIDGTLGRRERFGGLELSSPISSWTTHDVQLAWSSPWRGVVTFGVSNVADQDPPLDPNEPFGLGYSFDLYDSYGRTPYLRFTQSF